MKYVNSFILLIFVFSSLYSITTEDLIKETSERYGKYKIENYIIKTDHIYSLPGMSQMVSHQTLYKKRNKVRIETTMDMGETSMKTLFIGDGENMYFISGGQTQTMPYDLSKLKEDYFWWQNLEPNEIEIEGEDNVDDHICYVVSFLKNDNVDKMWIDENNFLLIKEEKTSPNIGKVCVILKDYKIHDHIYFPYKMEIYMDTLKVGEVKTVSIETGINIPDSLFVLPNSKDESLNDIMDKMMNE